MKKLGLYVTLLAFLSVPASAQTGQLHINVGPNIAITTDPNAPRNESWVAVDPTNPAHLIAVVTTLRDGETGHSAYDTTHVSFDGGNTWHEVDIPQLALT